jgi:hypothetical protein
LIPWWKGGGREIGRPLRIIFERMIGRANQLEAITEKSRHRARQPWARRLRIVGLAAHPGLKADLA